MVVSEIELYEILSAKIGKPEAKALTEFVEAKAEKKLVDKLSVFATKEDLAKEIASLEVRLTRNIFIAGVVQFLAIVGSALMLMKFHVG
jgi:hypothetical protein